MLNIHSLTKGMIPKRLSHGDSHHETEDDKYKVPDDFNQGINEKLSITYKIIADKSISNSFNNGIDAIDKNKNSNNEQASNGYSIFHMEDFPRGIMVSF